MKRKSRESPKTKASASLSVKNGAVSTASWKPHLDMYQHLRALRFSSAKDFALAANRLYSDRLRDLPYDLVGNRTVIVPQEAVACFKGLAFTETAVLSPEDLHSEELADLRRQQGPY
jgi:hypothetical protein